MKGYRTLGNFRFVGFRANIPVDLKADAFASRIGCQGVSAHHSSRGRHRPIVIAAQANNTILTMSPPASGGKVSSTPLAAKIFHETRVQQNDLVVFADHAGTWKVVAPVNGSKADIRRSGGFDTRIVTASLESLTVVRCVGSPGYSY